MRGFARHVFAMVLFKFAMVLVDVLFLVLSKLSYIFSVQGHHDSDVLQVLDAVLYHGVYICDFVKVVVVPYVSV